MTHTQKLRMACILGAGFLAVTAQAADWKSLIGDDLSDWKQLGGEARYVLEDGVIVGYTVPDSPNSFLSTSEEYGDFIIEYETIVEDGMNSGVMIRADVRDNGRNNYPQWCQRADHIIKSFIADMIGDWLQD